MRLTRLSQGTLLAPLLFALPATGQVRAAPTGVVESVAMLLGRWEGEAWIDMGPRGRQTLTRASGSPPRPAGRQSSSPARGRPGCRMARSN